MNDYSNFPPLLAFKRILQTSPHSALMYTSIYKLRSKTNRLTIKKSELKQKLLISPTIFRNHLLAMGRLDLVNFEEKSDLFVVEFNENNAN